MVVNSYKVEIDNIDGSRWTEILTQFDDASIYQTESYAVVRRGAANLSHLVLWYGNEIVGCCLVTFNRIPFLNIGIAYVAWGPLWRKRGLPPNAEVLAWLVRELKSEYAIKRGYFLRISPNAFGDQKAVFRCIMEGERFKPSRDTTPYRTLRLDLTPSLDELRSNFLQKWRNSLNKAEKLGLNVIEDSSSTHYPVFLALARQMLGRKKFIPGVDYEDYGRIQDILPDPLKMRIAVCESSGEPIAVAICSAIGDTGTYLLGASGDKAKGLNGAYLLHWRMIQWLKECNVRWYDLGGIDPQGNPGVYAFKRGLAGKHGIDEEIVGEYLGVFTLRAQASLCVLRAVNFIKGMYSHYSTATKSKQRVENTNEE